MFVPILNKSENPLPRRASDGAVGYDVCSNENATIHQKRTVAIGTGLHVEVPLGFELQVRSRSVLANNYSIFVLNSPGCIDPDYRGEVKVILHNAGVVPYQVQKGDRIAQLVLVPINSICWVEANLTETKRGEGGLGHTGR